MNGDKTHLAALRGQIVDALLDGLVHRTHCHDHVLGVGRSVIGEGLVCAARDVRDLRHCVGYHVGHGVIELVRGLASLEIDVGVLGRAARYGVLGIERARAELLQCVAVEHRGERSVVDDLDLLNFVRGAESVEEVQERNARLKRHDVRHACQIHYLLHRRGGQHGEACLTGGHYVLMVAEYRERLRGQCAGRDVEHAREQLARDLVHVGDHEQETLRRGEGRGERTALQRTVHRSRGSRFRLHLDNLDSLAEHVFLALSGPLVDQFGHCRRGRDGVNRSYLRKLVGYVSRCVITVARDEFLL